jgi:hypothetical protein
MYPMLQNEAECTIANWCTGHDAGADKQESFEFRAATICTRGRHNCGANSRFLIICMVTIEMPIVIKRPPRTPPPTPASTTPRPRLRRSDEAAKVLAPVIAEIRKAGHHGVAEIAKCLNERGLRATDGRPYSYETTRKRLKAIKRLGLGEGPRTASEALSARHKRERTRMLAELAELRETRKREHPDWDV